MNIESFFEHNYIDPKVKKFTDSHFKKGANKKFKCCGPCRQFFPYSEMTKIKYGNKQVMRCPECMKKYKTRNKRVIE